MKGLGIVFIIVSIICALGGIANMEPESERLAKGIERDYGPTDVSRDILGESRSERKTTMTWFFVGAGVLGLTGLILVVSAPQKKPQGHAPSQVPPTIHVQPPPPPPAKLYVYVNNETKGPFSMEQLKALLAVNTVTPETPCCREGSRDWQTVSTYVG
jgi:hypothetical protein